MSIIVSKKGQNTRILDKSDFQKENNLQEYIHNNLESIPVYELKENGRIQILRNKTWAKNKTIAILQKKLIIV